MAFSLTWHPNSAQSDTLLGEEGHASAVFLQLESLHEQPVDALHNSADYLLWHASTHVNFPRVHGPEQVEESLGVTDEGQGCLLY